MKKEYNREEMKENGHAVNQNRPMLANRHPHGGSDSPHDIMRAGGSDPRRHDAKIVIDRTITNHSMSGYNHNATPSQPANGGHENEMWMKKKSMSAMGMGTPEPDGTYRR